MRAIHLIKYGESNTAFDIRETPVPQADPGQIVIKVAASGLNFADVMARRGLYKEAPPLPAVLGYDVSGTVHEIGAGVKGINEGDAVTAMTRFGGYAEYVQTQAAAVAPIPKGWDAAKATALTTQACTAVFCAEEAVRLHQGDKVLIQAASGGVGRMLIQLAKQAGCEIYATASTAKQDYLRIMGVDHPIDYLSSDFYELISNSQNFKGLDVVFDNLGGKRYKQGLKLLAPGGKIVSYGAADQNKGSKTSKLGAIKVGLGFGFYSPIGLVVKSQSMIGVNMLRIADHRPHVLKKTLDRVIELVDEKVLDPVLDSVFPAEDIALAHDYLESRKSKGKVAVSW